VAKRKVVPVNAMTESERYLKAAELVQRKNVTVIEAIKEVGVCMPDFIELSKQAAWPYQDNWSEEFKRKSRVEKLLLMSELAK
jgi:hypothetical protein